MVKHCPTCGGKGVVATDCPYCRDCDVFEHSDLGQKKCTCCGDRGYREIACPICDGTGSLGDFRKVS